VWNIFVLALGAAFYPTLLAIVLVVLTRPRPARLLGAYLVGGMLAGLGVGFVVVFVLQGVGVKTGGGQSEGSAIIDIVVGVLSLGLAALLLGGHDPRPARLKEKRKPADPEKPSWTKRALNHDSLAIAFGLGVLLDLPSVWYLIALKDIVNGSYTATAEVLLIVGFNVIMFAVIEIPLVAYLLAPDKAAATVARSNAWIHSHARQLTEAVAGALGTYLVVKGVVAL
jgi:hypothetical protein